MSEDDMDQDDLTPQQVQDARKIGECLARLDEQVEETPYDN